MAPFLPHPDHTLTGETDEILTGVDGWSSRHAHSPVDVIQCLQIAPKSATRERHHDRNCGRSDRRRSACVVLGRSDTGAPVMDGIEFAQRVRRTPERAHVRLVALTSRRDDERT
jgi:CheY-like chemotaxis protein